MSSRIGITAARLVRWIRATFDLRDAFLAVGLGLLSAGLAQVWVPAAFMAPGLVLTLVAIFGARLSAAAAAREE